MQSADDTYTKQSIYTRQHNTIEMVNKNLKGVYRPPSPLLPKFTIFRSPFLLIQSVLFTEKVDFKELILLTYSPCLVRFQLLIADFATVQL